MNYLTRAPWLFMVVIVISFVGLSSLQAHDSEHPHEHDEPAPTAQPENPRESGSSEDANSPDDFWGPPDGTNPTAEPNIEDELPFILNLYVFPTCPEGEYPTMPEVAPGGPLPLPSQYVCAPPPTIPSAEEFKERFCALEGETRAITAVRIGLECAEICDSVRDQKTKAVCVATCIGAGNYIIGENFEKCE